MTQSSRLAAGSTRWTAARRLLAEPTPVPARLTRRAVVTGVLVIAVIAVATLLWAKWLPYVDRAQVLSASHTWSGAGILQVGGVRPGDAPSWAAATSFFTAYLGSVWKALLAAVLISAAIQALLPRNWLARTMNRRGPWSSAVAGGVLSAPTMMCTCCTAPVAATLRRSGVRTSAAVAYWLGNPLLNPAVLVFLVLVAPWQWTVTRLVVGIGLVVGGAALVERVTERRVPAAALDQVAAAADDTEEAGSAAAPERFARALLRMLVTLVPEYLIIVLLIGGFRGWLFPLGDNSSVNPLLVVMVAALVGTAMVIPTAGEIPILQGLALAGMTVGGVGALLVTLPAVSIPAMIMLSRALGWRVVGTTAAVVAGGGVVAGGMLWVLT